MTLGERIQRLRKSKGLSQEQLAQILQVSRQTISKWESDINHPELEKLKEISAYFEVSIDELLGLEGGKSYENENSQPVQAITGKKFYTILAGALIIVLVIIAFSYHQLSSRLDAMQNSITALQARGGHTVYVDSNPVYGFLNDVNISYTDVDIENRQITQIISFSLNSQKEEARLWGEYRKEDGIEKIEAIQTASLSYEIRKQVSLDDTISLTMIYEDEDGIKSDRIAFEKSVMEEAIGYLAWADGMHPQFGTTTTMDGQLLKVRIQDTIAASLPNTSYPFEVDSFLLEAYNHEELLEQKSLEWQDYEGEQIDIFQTIDTTFEKLLEEGDEIIIRVYIEDEKGLRIYAPDILHLSYTKASGLTFL